MMGLQQNIGDNKKKISEPEDRTIEIIQPEQHRDNILKIKTSRVLDIYGTKTEYLTLVFWKKRRKRTELKESSNLYWLKSCPKLVKDINLQILKGEKPQTVKKEIHPKACHDQTSEKLKTKRKS